ncbi:hypothetical protein CRUP_016239 [Coryphaenoides rupestris]|nr:hypothetical protein CRUP_016239 [Coryphaenoides rupestris]
MQAGRTSCWRRLQVSLFRLLCLLPTGFPVRSVDMQRATDNITIRQGDTAIIRIVLLSPVLQMDLPQDVPSDALPCTAHPYTLIPLVTSSFYCWWWWGHSFQTCTPHASVAEWSYGSYYYYDYYYALP